MDYAALINHHRARGADVTIATTAADEDHARHLGILEARRPASPRAATVFARAGLKTPHPCCLVAAPSARGPPPNPRLRPPPPPPPPPPRRHRRRRRQVDAAMNVVRFEEKPPESTLHTMSMDTASAFALSPRDAEARPYVASMGVYVFKKKARGGGVGRGRGARGGAECGARGAGRAALQRSRGAAAAWGRAFPAAFGARPWRECGPSTPSPPPNPGPRPPPRPPPQALLELLGPQHPGAVDFSRDVLPAALGERAIVAYAHDSVRRCCARGGPQVQLGSTARAHPHHATTRKRTPTPTHPHAHNTHAHTRPHPRSTLRTWGRCATTTARTWRSRAASWRCRCSTRSAPSSRSRARCRRQRRGGGGGRRGRGRGEGARARRLPLAARFAERGPGRAAGARAARAGGAPTRARAPARARGRRRTRAYHAP